jgi:2-dehydro-3-deoxygalactonokinase
MHELSGMTSWPEAFIAVDWGTTNRRAYLVNARGEVVSEMEDELGVSSIQPGDFRAAIDAITQRLGDKPILLAGMIGSNRGWREAPYVRCPAGLPELTARLEWIEPGCMAIVPGLSWVEGPNGDVMRGEEVQVFGLLRRTQASAMTICHPGTHTKWIAVEDGRIMRFRTVMTGELFSLLRQHSILSPLLQGEPEAGPAFYEGVDRGFSSGALSAELFSIRARVLLSLLAEDVVPSYASGLLIGCDLKGSLDERSDGEVVVLGRPSLTRLYAGALRHCGRTAREVDGAEAFVSGMVAIKEAMT